MNNVLYKISGYNPQSGNRGSFYRLAPPRQQKALQQIWESKGLVECKVVRSRSEQQRNLELARVAGLRAGAKAAKAENVRREAMPFVEGECHKCDGTGQYQSYGSCYQCKGKGKLDADDVVRCKKYFDR